MTGASFFADVYAAAGGGDPNDTLRALWDLVWAGEVTNDTLAPVRAFVRGAAPAHRRGKRVFSTATPPSGVGRWSAVADLLASSPTAEEGAAAIAAALLERYGIVGRDTVLAEGVPGGYAGLYPVFAALEDVGTARRGYFVEGLGGSQFGMPGAVDRLRSREPGGLVVLAAADPANAYGAGIAWPAHRVAKAARRAGAYVVIDDGALIAFVDRGGRSVSAYVDDPSAVARGLALVGPRFKRWTIERINAIPVADSPHREAIVAAGFSPGYRGLTFRG
jgi:ATP-dependent Lhr-like helicase